MVAAGGCDLAAKDTATPLDGDARATAVQASARPFIVNWSPTDRTALETRASEGSVVVAVNDENVTVLPRCRAPGEYRFVGSSHASQQLAIEDKAELGAKLPFSGPVDLGATLQAYGLLTVEYHSIGEWRLDRDNLHEKDLTGDCTGASHLLGSLSVGAFEFFAGQKVGGSVEAKVPMAATAGGSASHEYKHLDKGGDMTACESAAARAENPVERCDSVLAIELVPLQRESPFVAGQRWQGTYECGGRKAAATIEIVEVPAGAPGGAADVQALFSFDYGKEKGSYTLRGAFDGTTSGLTMSFGEWKQQPEGFVPISPSGTLSADRREFSGTLTETGCGPFSFVRRE
ncbi:MAG TPA: hypothetical protein VFG69_20455 [Nannocystaceae bacterium]|nr:hypothetical protein [Nannocystaceae bacterium]